VGTSKGHPPLCLHRQKDNGSGFHVQNHSEIPMSFADTDFIDSDTLNIFQTGFAIPPFKISLSDILDGSPAVMVGCASLHRPYMKL
jgi:hypothetical protein